MHPDMVALYQEMVTPRSGNPSLRLLSFMIPPE